MKIITDNPKREQLQEIIEQTYSKIFGSLPNHIEQIEILSRDRYVKRYKEIENKLPLKDCHGACYVHQKNGNYQILLEDFKEIEKTAALVGHEIGHTLKPNLSNITRLAILEEAKAYSFQKLWAEHIAKYNIGGIGAEIVDSSESLISSGLKGQKFRYLSIQLVNKFDHNCPGRLYRFLDHLASDAYSIYSTISGKKK